MPEMPEEPEKKYLGPSVLAAVVWLALSLYMFVVVPIQMDMQMHASKPEQMRAEMPPIVHNILRFQESRGTAGLALLGIVGCGLAYIRRSAALANVMVLVGAVCLVALVWAVLASMPKN